LAGQVKYTDTGKHLSTSLLPCSPTHLSFTTYKLC